MKKLRKNGSNGDGVEGNSLSDLTPDMLRPPEVKVESLPTLVDMSATEAQDKQVEEDAAKGQQWATSVLAWLNQYNRSSQAQRDRFAAEATKYRKILDGLLNHENQTIRRAAWLAQYNSRFSQAFANHDELAGLLTIMVNNYQLVVTNSEEPDLPGGKDWKGRPRTAYGKKYNFPSLACFEPKHVAEIQQAFNGLRTRVWAEVRKAWQDKWGKVSQMGSPNLEDLLAGKPGEYVVDVPPDSGKGGGGNFALEGGLLLLKSTGEKVSVVDVVNEVRGWGNFESTFRDAMSLRPSLFLQTWAIQPERLRQEKPPFFIKDMPDHGRKAWLLWYAIKRAWEKNLTMKEQGQQAEEVIDDEKAEKGQDSGDTAVAGTDASQ